MDYRGKYNICNVCDKNKNCDLCTQSYRNSLNSSRDGSSSELLSFGVAAVTNSAILGTIVGGDIGSSVMGDLLNGDLFD